MRATGYGGAKQGDRTALTGKVVDVEVRDPPTSDRSPVAYLELGLLCEQNIDAAWPDRYGKGYSGSPVQVGEAVHGVVASAEGSATLNAPHAFAVTALVRLEEAGFPARLAAALEDAAHTPAALRDVLTALESRPAFRRLALPPPGQEDSFFPAAARSVFARGPEAVLTLLEKLEVPAPTLDPLRADLERYAEDLFDPAPSRCARCAAEFSSSRPPSRTP